MQTSTTYDLSTPMWIAFVVLAFILFWPLGVMILCYLMCSGKMRNRGKRAASWKSNDFRCCGFRYDKPRGPGNMAFDEYREATLKRLDKEQQEFTEFVKQLRRAKDQDEFDKFMSERAAGRSQAPTSK